MTIAYFGNRFNKFIFATKDISTIFHTEKLPPDRQADIIVIDKAPNINVILPIGTVGIVLSDNISALHCLMRSGVKTITCGMSHRDTITLSSSLPNPTICLQRRLCALNGKIFEPAEYPISTSVTDYECLLLAAATMLLCGTEPK